MRLARKLQTAGERLRRAVTTSESLLLNGVSFSLAIAFIQDINENLMDRVTHTSIPGPLEWSAALFSLAEESSSFDEEEWQYALRDISYDRDEHDSSIAIWLDRLGEALEEEQE